MTRNAASVLRYPGGKGRAVPHLAPLLPDVEGAGVLYSPFFGGGALELHLLATRPALSVVANDISAPLINFWQCVRDDAALVARHATALLPVLTTASAFARLRDLAMDTGASERYRSAAAFFACNRCAYAGALAKGFVNAQRFTPAAIARLTLVQPLLRRIVFHNRDALAFLGDVVPRAAAVFLDPPYLGVGRRLYGRGASGEDFDHEALRACLERRPGAWVLCYNDCDEVRRMYAAYRIAAGRWRGSIPRKRPMLELVIQPPA